jgi:transposase
MGEQPKIEIPLDLPDVRVLRTHLTAQRELIIQVESTLTSTTCRRCGQIITNFYGYDRPLRLRHLPSFGYVVYIELRSKRFRCPVCSDHPTTTQHLSWYDPKALHTKAYERYLLVQLIGTTIADVCQKEDLTPDALQGILDRWIETEVDWTAVPVFSILGVDEIARRKGHRDFVAVVSARLATGGIYPLAVLPDRSKETMCRWLASIPPAIQCKIATVCSDMWEAYVSAVATVLPKARIVIDRFHVAQHYRDGADTLRKQELKRLKQELPEEEAKTLNPLAFPQTAGRSYS